MLPSVWGVSVCVVLYVGSVCVWGVCSLVCGECVALYVGSVCVCVGSV